MKIFTSLCFGLFLLFIVSVAAQEKTHDFSATLTVAKDLQKNFKKDGRLLVFIANNPNVEPRQLTWPSPRIKTYIFAKNIKDFNPKKEFVIANANDWVSNKNVKMSELPEGEYAVQAIWDHDTKESRINAPDNLYSTKQIIKLDKDTKVDLVIDQKIPERKVNEHELVREVNFKSEALSKFWKKPMFLKATILLPKGYKEDSGKAYPIRYNVAGYGGRYTRINRLTSDKKFMDWWLSDEAPQVISVFLDGEGPFGDSYQMDSDNSGPYGESLINELIPHIEKKYRGTDTAKTRFVDGCSTGGWVSLGLQLYYPDSFNGCFSYSPDAIEFVNYQLTNIYKDKNIYVNEFGYERPIMRSILGEPMVSTRQFLYHENALGSSDSYLTSGGQIGSHTALYSPKGENGLPKPLFDPISGEIDHSVAEHWKKYDFKEYAEKKWATLAPKIKGKIYVWMGDMDHFYLNMATRAFADYLKTKENPKSDAVIEFSPMEGHCSKYSHRIGLEKVQERLKQLGEL